MGTQRQCLCIPGWLCECSIALRRDGSAIPYDITATTIATIVAPIVTFQARENFMDFTRASTKYHRTRSPCLGGRYRPRRILER